MTSVLSIKMTMVGALHRQRVAARGPARGAFAGLRPRKARADRSRARKAQSPRPRPRTARVDRRRVRAAPVVSPIGSRPGGEAPYALLSLERATRGGKARGAPPYVRLWRRMRSLPRPAAIGALAAAVIAAVVPAGLVVAAARPSQPPQPAAHDQAHTAFRQEAAVVGASASLAGAQDSAEPAPVPDLAMRSYQVQAGDSLSEIAHRFDVDLDTLISFNGIRDVAELREGVELSIPNASGLSYVVRPGDTLSGIADRHGVRADELRAWNELGSTALAVGRRLFIPGVPLPEQERNAVLGRLFLKPAPGSIATPYGYQADPVTGIRRFHDGIDIEHAASTPIIASMAGRVGRVGVSGAYGRYVVLVHADGYQTLYAQLARAHVTAGSFVAQGQTIGAMGTSGYGVGSHLHFSIFKDGQPVDPSRYMH